MNVPANPQNQEKLSVIKVALVFLLSGKIQLKQYKGLVSLIMGRQGSSLLRVTQEPLPSLVQDLLEKEGS